MGGWIGGCVLLHKSVDTPYTHLVYRVLLCVHVLRCVWDCLLLLLSFYLLPFYLVRLRKTIPIGFIRPSNYLVVSVIAWSILQKKILNFLVFKNDRNTKLLKLRFCGFEPTLVLHLSKQGGFFLFFNCSRRLTEYTFSPGNAESVLDIEECQIIAYIKVDEYNTCLLIFSSLLHHNQIIIN